MLASKYPVGTTLVITDPEKCGLPPNHIGLKGVVILDAGGFGPGGRILVTYPADHAFYSRYKSTEWWYRDSGVALDEGPW